MDHVVLEKRSQPYIVNADLTVMPEGSLVIESGAELQFYPNIGILVLGTMSVSGKSHSHVKFNPVDQDTIDFYRAENTKKRRKKRQIPGSVHTDLHGHGGVKRCVLL